MTTTLNPPPVAPGGPPAPPSPSRAGRVITIIMVVVGSLVLVGALGSAVVATLAAASSQTSSTTVDVAGVTDLDVDVAAGSLTVEFTDVDEAELDVRSSWGLARWTLSRDGEELTVSSPQGFFGAGWLFGGSGDAILRLPLGLAGLDADLGISAGDVRVDGDFGELDLDLGAGSADIAGSARELDAQISAGRAVLELADVRSASFGVSAGSMDAVLTGAQPREIEAEVSAGDLDLTVPEGAYAVASDVSAGELDNRLDTASNARSTITVQVSAGQATLRAG